MEMGRGNALAHTLRGVEPPSGYRADALIALVGQPGKACLVALVVVLAGMEAATSAPPA